MGYNQIQDVNSENEMRGNSSKVEVREERRGARWLESKSEVVWEPQKNGGAREPQLRTEEEYSKK